MMNARIARTIASLVLAVGACGTPSPRTDVVKHPRVDMARDAGADTDAGADADTDVLAAAQQVAERRVFPDRDGPPGMGCFEAPFSARGIEIVAGFATEHTFVLVSAEGTRFAHRDDRWVAIEVHVGEIPPVARVVLEEDRQWHVARLTRDGWERASPTQRSSEVGHPSIADADASRVLLLSHTHAFEVRDGALTAVRRASLRRGSPARMAQATLGASREGAVGHDGGGFFIVPTPIEGDPVQEVASGGGRVIVASGDALFSVDRTGFRPLPRYAFMHRGLIDVTAEYVHVLHGREGWRLMRLAEHGAESRPILVAAYEPRVRMIVRDTLLTASGTHAVRCPLDDTWVDIEPLEIIWNARSPIRRGQGFAPAYYRPTDPRYVWPPTDRPGSGGVVFDDQGRVLYQHRVRRCDGDGCDEHVVGRIDLRSNRRIEYERFDASYRWLTALHEQARRAAGVTVRSDDSWPSVVTLESILPRWMLHVERHGTHDVLSLVDPTNQHALDLARLPAQGSGQCWRGEDCVSCPGTPSIGSGALSPDGSWLVVYLSVHEPACDCHTSSLTLSPIVVSVPRMLEFARSVVAGRTARERPRSAPAR